MSDNATWRQMIDGEREDKADGPIIACTLTDEELDAEFYASYGTAHGKAFTAWTENRVYFPVVYDGAEWVGSVPRNPCDEASSHFGGQ